MNISAFDSKRNFLRIGLSSHCLWDKGRFAPPKKASCPGNGTRRPSKWKKRIELILPYIISFCGLMSFYYRTIRALHKTYKFPIEKCIHNFYIQNSLRGVSCPTLPYCYIHEIQITIIACKFKWPQKEKKKKSR